MKRKYLSFVLSVTLLATITLTSCRGGSNPGSKNNSSESVFSSDVADSIISDVSGEDSNSGDNSSEDSSSEDSSSIADNSGSSTQNPSTNSIKPSSSKPSSSSKKPSSSSKKPSSSSSKPSSSSSKPSSSSSKPSSSSNKSPSSSSKPSSNNSSSGQNNSGSAVKKVTISIKDYEQDNTDYEALYWAISDVNLMQSAALVRGENVAYTLKLRNKKYIIDGTLELVGCSNFTLDGAGATIVMKTNKTAIQLKDCNNFTIRNLSLDYDPLWFTQGTITAINGNDLTLKIDAGYPDDYERFLTNKYSVMRLHDPKTGGHLAGATTDYEVSGITKTANGVLQATMSIPYTNAGQYRPQVGNRFSLYECHSGAVIMTNCKNTTYNAFNIYTSMGFGIHEIAGPGGTVMKNCKIVPGAKPSGATADRMLSTLGDATHFQSVEKGPQLDGCTITHCCDDGINAHGFFYRVVKISGNDVYVAFCNADDWVKGDTVNFFDTQNYNCRGSAKIADIKLVQDSSLTVPGDSLSGTSKYAKGWYYCITLDKKVSGISVGDDVSDPNRMSSGAVVKNCTFGYNRARGIVLKGEDSIVENNTVKGCSAAGIMVISEFSWAEGGFSNRSVVRNNKVTACGLDSRVQYGTDSVASIMVLISPKNKGFYQSTSTKDIIIENNTVNNAATFGIFVSNCDGVTVKGNKITNPFATGINNIGAVYGVKPKSGILIGMSKNITAVNNTVVCSRNEITQAVDILSNCSSVKNSSGNTISK